MMVDSNGAEPRKLACGRKVQNAAGHALAGHSNPVREEGGMNSPGHHRLRETASVRFSWIAELKAELRQDRNHPEGPKRSVLMRPASKPSSINDPEILSTKPEGPQT